MPFLLLIAAAIIVGAIIQVRSDRKYGPYGAQGPVQQPQPPARRIPKWLWDFD